MDSRHKRQWSDIQMNGNDSWRTLMLIEHHVRNRTMISVVSHLPAIGSVADDQCGWSLSSSSLSEYKRICWLLDMLLSSAVWYVNKLASGCADMLAGLSCRSSSK